VRRLDAAAVWYAADLLALAVVGVLGVLFAVTGRGPTPGETLAALLAILAGRLTPRGPMPPSGAAAADGPPLSRRGAPTGSPGALRSAFLGLAGLWAWLHPPGPLRPAQAA
jgi:hypothetical protein